MTLVRYGHLLNDDLSGVADALGKAVDVERFDQAGSARSKL
jgi:hypothetical protein